MFQPFVPEDSEKNSKNWDIPQPYREDDQKRKLELVVETARRVWG